MFSGNETFKEATLQRNSISKKSKFEVINFHPSCSYLVSLCLRNIDVSFHYFNKMEHFESIILNFFANFLDQYNQLESLNEYMSKCITSNLLKILSMTINRYKSLFPENKLFIASTCRKTFSNNYLFTLNLF